ncbi:MAG: hypothetical protein ACOH18_02835 [Candidatus Saccharimonadaceae bacterium]
MLWALLISATVVAVSGLVLKFVAPWFRSTDSDWDIDWNEFIAGFIAAVIVVIPLVFLAGKAWSTAEALTYQEFYNGVETSATARVEGCQPGHSGSGSSSGHSNCDYEYRTGETYTYQEAYTVTVPDGVDSKGNPKTKSETRYRTETAYIYNPYASKEYHYVIADSLGGDYGFPKTYVKDGQGYNGQAIPADIPRGDPAEWLDAKKHLDEADPRPVTRVFSYKNYILASHDELLKAYSADIQRYKEAKLLPDHTKNITSDPLYGFSGSYADKVSFVGVKVADESAWQKSLMSLDAALGSELQGDLHLVLIDASLVDSPTDYTNALKAYWSGDDFGRRAIAKNAIIVVAGVQGDKISWAKATTGMPFGNDVMLQGIANFLPDTSLTPAQVIGAPRTVVTPAKGDKDDDVKVTISAKPGVLERIVLQDFPFQRACMECTNDKGDQIGYKGLVSQIEPSTGQWAIMISVVFVLSLIYWVLAARKELFNWLPWVHKPPRRRNDPYNRYDRYKY